MASEEKEVLVKSLLKINIYSVLVFLVVFLSTDLFTGLLAFPVILVLLASIPSLLDLESFSEKAMLIELKRRFVRLI